MHVDLLEHMFDHSSVKWWEYRQEHEEGPGICPYGHVLGPYAVRRWWQPCPCRPGRKGHTVYTCVACEELGRGSEAEMWPAGCDRINVVRTLGQHFGPPR